MTSANRFIQIALYAIAFAMAIYHLAYTQMLLQGVDAHLITHLGFGLTIVFLSQWLKKTDKKSKSLALILLILSLLVTAYLMYELDDILEYRTAVPLTSDLLIGALIICVLLVGNWMVFGRTFTLVSLVAIAYLIFGKHLPAPFTVPSISFTRMLMWMSVELSSGKGVYGEVLDLSATYLYLFIFFGGVLYAFGGTRFVIGLGRWVGSKLSSGPAMVALFGSTLLGTITGSTVANITITGSFTIPIMKKSGYTAEQAGAIETVSSNGGQITPPIMGSTAFLMAGYAKIPYLQIATAAIIPALLYFACVFFYITLTANKMNIKAKVDSVSAKELLLDSPIFVLPLGVLIVLLLQGYTLPFVGFWSIMTIIVVGVLSSILRKDARLNFFDVFKDIVKAVISGAQVAMICGLLGVVVSAVTSSGLAIKLPLAIENLSGGILLIALFITGVSSLILGIGMPTPAAYMLVAIGAVPTLINMGVEPLSAHLFCFYFAICSHITPPIAIGALVAAQIAGGDYWKTSWEALKAAFPKYLLPFLFVYTPIVLLRPESGFIPSLMQFAAMSVAIFAMQIGVSSYCFTVLSIIEITTFIAAALLSLVALFMMSEIFFFISLVVFIASLIRQLMKRKTLPVAV
jgi:TRAP transporter 4TM/12TM fusion protein